VQYAAWILARLSVCSTALVPTMDECMTVGVYPCGVLCARQTPGSSRLVEDMAVCLPAVRGSEAGGEVRACVCIAAVRSETNYSTVQCCADGSRQTCQ
jgi:hypothetical protein